MSIVSKLMIFGSMGVSALVAALSLMDIFAGTPFGGQTVMDIMFLLGAGIVIFMSWDAYQDVK